MTIHVQNWQYSLLSEGYVADTITFLNVHKSTYIHYNGMCVHKSIRPTFCGGRESILNLILIFSLHFDIRFYFVVVAYPTKRRLTIGNSCINLLSIQRDLLFRIPSQNLKRI